MNVVITGANRGIGLELARQYIGRGDHVFAGVRTEPATGELAQLERESAGRLHVLPCDVASLASAQAFAAAIDAPADILINNAGISLGRPTFETAKLAEFETILNVNALGALRVTQALLPRLRQATGAKVASISSRLGSIAESDGGSLAYRMSKAALNMAMRTVAAELRSDNIIVVALSPGWVKTDMGGAQAPTSAHDSAAGLIRVITRLTPQDSGSFLDYKGEPIAW